MPHPLTYNVIVVQDGVSKTYLKGQGAPSVDGQTGHQSADPRTDGAPSEPPSLPVGDATSTVMQESADVQTGVVHPRTFSELRVLRRFRQDELALSLGMNPSEFTTRAQLCDALAKKLGFQHE